MSETGIPPQWGIQKIGMGKIGVTGMNLETRIGTQIITMTIMASTTTTEWNNPGYIRIVHQTIRIQGVHFKVRYP